MKWFYIRWGGILFIGLMIAFLGIQRYDREVTTMSPEQLLREKPTGIVRVLGMVQSGSLIEKSPFNQASFQILGEGEGEGISVQYTGERPDNLRELKTLVVVGRWDPSAREFKAHDISLVPNYGYVTAAYLIGMIPIGLFLFFMERRVELLYTEIRSAKVYEPEDEGFDKG